MLFFKTLVNTLIASQLHLSDVWSMVILINIISSNIIGVSEVGRGIGLADHCQKYPHYHMWRIICWTAENDAFVFLFSEEYCHHYLPCVYFY